MPGDSAVGLLDKSLNVVQIRGSIVGLGLSRAFLNRDQRSARGTQCTSIGCPISSEID